MTYPGVSLLSTPGVLGALLIFLLKSSLVSGLLYGYYRLFLRNRLFHQYNRCFLLGIILVALILPLVPLPAFYSLPQVMRSPALSGAIHAITPGEWTEGGYSRSRRDRGIQGEDYRGDIRGKGSRCCEPCYPAGRHGYGGSICWWRRDPCTDCCASSGMSGVCAENIHPGKK